MSNSIAAPSSWAHFTHGLMRAIIGFLFTAHGTQKLFDFPAASAHPIEDIFTLPGLAGIIELAGGVLVMIGLFTRPAAFLCSGLMAFAYFMAHAGQNFWPVLNGGELAVAYCFVFLFLSAAGGGGLSIDALRSSPD